MEERGLSMLLAHRDCGQNSKGSQMSSTHTGQRKQQARKGTACLSDWGLQLFLGPRSLQQPKEQESIIQRITTVQEHGVTKRPVND